MMVLFMTLRVHDLRMLLERAICTLENQQSIYNWTPSYAQRRSGMMLFMWEIKFTRCGDTI